MAPGLADRAVTPFHLRRAETRDLGALNAIFHQAQSEDFAESPPLAAEGLAIFPHEIATGEVWVAQSRGRVVGFAAVIERGATAFLAELFVTADHRSAGIGGALVRRAFGPRGLLRSTLSSEDPRARALYAGLGLEPRWPLAHLVGRSGEIAATPCPAHEIETDDTAGVDLARLDADACGRSRAIDLDFWRREGRALFLTLRRGGRPAGYALVRRRSEDWIGRGDGATIGPLGAVGEDDVLPLAWAAVAVARARSPWIRIAVPEPSPLLSVLVDLGFRVAERDTFMADPGPLPFDPRRYVPSGGALF